MRTGLGCERERERYLVERGGDKTRPKEWIRFGPSSYERAATNGDWPACTSTNSQSQSVPLGRFGAGLGNARVTIGFEAAQVPTYRPYHTGRRGGTSRVSPAAQVFGPRRVPGLFPRRVDQEEVANIDAALVQ